MKCSLGISDFLDEISSLSHSIVFLYFFELIAEEGFLISSCYSLEFCIQMLFPFLLCFSLLFSSQLLVRSRQTAILLLCISYPWGWSWSVSPVQCQEPPSIVHQALKTPINIPYSTLLLQICLFHLSPSLSIIILIISTFPSLSPFFHSLICSQWLSPPYPKFMRLYSSHSCV